MDFEKLGELIEVMPANRKLDPLTDALASVLQELPDKMYWHRGWVLYQPYSVQVFGQYAFVDSTPFDKPKTPKEVAEMLISFARNGASYTEKPSEFAEKGWRISKQIGVPKPLVVACADWDFIVRTKPK